MAASPEVGAAAAELCEDAAAARGRPPGEDGGDSKGMRLYFDDDGDVEGVPLEPWVGERFEYFGRLLHGGFREGTSGRAKVKCKREVFKTFTFIAKEPRRLSSVDLSMRMQVLRFADMVSASSMARQLADSIRVDYLSDGDGVRDSALEVLCELADLLQATGSDQVMDDAACSESARQGSGDVQQTTATVWLVAASGMSRPPQEAGSTGDGCSTALAQLRSACFATLPQWTRKRLMERPDLWRLDIAEVLDVFGSEASPRAESSWLALHAARRLSRDILAFASSENERSAKLIEDHPAMVIRKCISLCVRELPFRKAVCGFGDTEYQIQITLAPGSAGGWVLGVGGKGLCAVRRVLLQVEDGNGFAPEVELEFNGLMEHASKRQEDAVLGFASGVQQSSLPATAKVTIFEYPLHLAVQNYIGLNFSTMAMLCQGFDFGPMDLACVMDLWLQSEQLRRVPEVEIAEVVRRTLKFVKASWAPVVRCSFVVCMHSCWMQASQLWWHESLVRSCMDLEVWCLPADGELGAGTFRSYVAQIVQHALRPHFELFLAALQACLARLPPVRLTDIEESLPQAVDSPSDPVAIVTRHYLDLLRSEGVRTTEAGAEAMSVRTLVQILDGFIRLVGPPLERTEPRTAVKAFLAIVALCDLRHQRRMVTESLASLAGLHPRAADGLEARFWAGCFFAFLEFYHKHFQRYLAKAP